MIALFPHCGFLSETSRMLAIHEALRAAGHPVCVATHGGPWESLLDRAGVDWVQLDAPRHIFLHTEKSMQILCDQAGLTLSGVIYDSWNLQFYGSELYKRNIPLRANKEKEVFSGQQMDEFTTESITLNKKKQGDQACFYLTRES